MELSIIRCIIICKIHEAINITKSIKRIKDYTYYHCETGIIDIMKYIINLGCFKFESNLIIDSLEYHMVKIIQNNKNKEIIIRDLYILLIPFMEVFICKYIKNFKKPLRLF